MSNKESQPTLGDRMTIHGFNEVSLSSNVVAKGIWIAVMCVGLCIMSVYMYVIATYYIGHPVYTKFEKVDTDDTFLPDILICPRQFIDQNRLKSFGIRSVVDLTSVVYSVYSNERRDAQFLSHCFAAALIWNISKY